MTTEAETAELHANIAIAEANKAATAAVDVQNKVAIAETSANTAANHANTVGASVDGAEAANVASGLSAIESKNYRDLALLWGNADPNVIVEDQFYSARHYALLTINMLAVMQAELDAQIDNHIDNKAVTDAALDYLGFRLDTGLLSFDTTALEDAIDAVESNTTVQLEDKLNTVLYNSDKLGLANFAKSNDISVSNKIIDYLDEAGQIALQGMISGATNQTKLSYAGIIVDPDTGNITSAAGTAVATEFGVRVAAIEETIGSSVQPGLGTMQSKYTVKTDVNGHIAGFGLINTANTDVEDVGFSEFIINADSFKVSDSQSVISPFRVITDGGVVGGGVCISSTGVEIGGVTQEQCELTNGRWNGPGMYVQDAYILKATIGAVHVTDLLTVGSEIGNALNNLEGVLQGQIDGSITTHFLNGEPTLSNAPYTEWATDAIRNQHLGDLYYDNETGFAYRFKAITTSYGWGIITDSGIAAALLAGNNAQATADGKVVTFFQIAEPASEVSSLGDMWFDTDDGNKPHRYSGSAWQAVQDTGLKKLADDAQATADGKILSFFQDGQPSTAAGDVLSLGDLWFNTTNGDNTPYRYNGAVWSPAQDAGLKKLANDAQATADGKITTFYADDEPEDTTAYTLALGDLWIDTNDKNKLHRYDGGAWQSIQDTTVADNIYYGNTTKIDGGNIQANTLSLTAADVGIGTDSGANRIVITSDTIKVYNNNVLRVTLGNLN
jgi:hypothetical protein